VTRRVSRVALIGAGIVLVASLAFLIWRGAGARTAASLVVGECFDVPTAANRIEDVRDRACSGPHGGEVFHAYEASVPSAAYPTDAGWEAMIYPVCDPVFETYTGTPVGDRLDIGYLFLVPTADRWAAGDRRVTCFITALDGTQLTRSYHAAP
jgi:putative regulator of septum formation